MLAQSSCASRFGRRLLFLSMFFPDVHLAGWLLSVTVLITASAALIGVRAGGHLARPFRVIRLLVVAVVALDGQRPAIRSLPDDYSIAAQHRVVSARASRCPLRVCARGLFRIGARVFREKVGTPATYEDSESALATGRVRVLVRRGAGCVIAYRPDDRERAGERYRRESQVHAHRLLWRVPSNSCTRLGPPEATGARHSPLNKWVVFERAHRQARVRRET